MTIAAHRTLDYLLLAGWLPFTQNPCRFLWRQLD